MPLYVDKPDTMQNELVEIRADGLVANSNYTFRMILTHNHGTHKSEATFRADSKGRINLRTAKPIRGTYHDVDQMGLFLSMQPCEDFPFGGYLRCTPPVPFYYKLMLIDQGGKVCDEVFIKKHWMHPKIERTELDSFGFCGTLFKPPGDGPFPCVMDLSGTGGGIHEHKGAMLASEGFVVLSVAFFQYKDLPAKMDNVDLDYFIKPIDYLLSLPYTKNKLGIQGVSFGATIVDLLATRHGDKIKAVVSINGPNSISNYLPLREHGQAIPHYCVGDVPLDKLRIINNIMTSDKNFQAITPELTPQTEIPWWRIPTDVKIRVIGSVDDLCQPSVHATLYRQRRLKESGHDVEIELVNGGHIMEPPYFPHHDLVYAKYQGFYCGYGGEVVLHAKSQERTWVNTIKFFKRTLGQPMPMPDWERLAYIRPPSKNNDSDELRSRL